LRSNITINNKENNHDYITILSEGLGNYSFHIPLSILNYRTIYLNFKYILESCMISDSKIGNYFININLLVFLLNLFLY